MSWVKSEFNLNQGSIDAIYFCPHHSVHGKGKYLVDCECRKPKPGMILKAIEDHNIDASKSILIGDKKTDIKAGKLAKIKTILKLGDSEVSNYSTNIKHVSGSIKYL